MLGFIITINFNTKTITACIMKYCPTSVELLLLQIVNLLYLFRCGRGVPELAASGD